MFKFRLQRVLQWKEQREQEAAMQLAEAREARAAAERRLVELAGVRDAGVQSTSQMQHASPTAGQLQNMRLLVERVERELEQAQGEADAADRAVQQRLAEFTTAFQERRVLERLREKGLESWTAEQLEEDRKLMDSIALNGFMQKKGAAAPRKED